MQLNEIDYGKARPIDGYGPGFFRVGGEVFHGPVLVTDGGGQGWGGLDDTDALLALSGRVDVLFLGMGDQIAHPPRDLVEALEQAGVMVETMASPTAARTYNVTLGEGRRVACALLPV